MVNPLLLFYWGVGMKISNNEFYHENTYRSPQINARFHPCL